MDKDELYDLIRGYVTQTNHLAKATCEYLSEVLQREDVDYHMDFPDEFELEPVHYIDGDGGEHRGIPVCMDWDDGLVTFTIDDKDGIHTQVYAHDIDQCDLIYLMRDMFELGHETGV